ncbi:MAG: hypothetical protein SH818_10530 [Saprospiraceae bacterium]|nr:hypothetical protein [Saprospiraceae bacterium]
MKQVISYALVFTSFISIAQNVKPKSPKHIPPVNFTADQDRQNMIDQLGIKSLRPGPSGDESAPNHANYNESTANPLSGFTRSFSFEKREKGDDTGIMLERKTPGNCR